MNELQTSISKCRVEGNTLFLPPIKDGALANYNEVKKALMNAGAKYVRNTFVFPNDAQPYIDRLMGGEKVNLKKQFQFFGTSDKLSDEVIEYAEIKESDEVLEPSAGQGAIVKAVHRKFPNKIVSCVELMPENIMILQKIKNAVHLTDDFLRFSPSSKNCFDKIVANPPFSKNQDIIHIHKMYECLKKGGRLVSIASKHWQSSKNAMETEFRGWLKELNAKVIEVPAGEFKESGTSIATVIIIIDKK